MAMIMIWMWMRFQIGSLAHIGVDNSQREYTGLDYVDHDDILPYTVKKSETRLQHNMIDTFLKESRK
uniref:Uncharacterized protein n=1 Tax=Romanomermis culicivorax TaxID=13658 RepID=A0A915J0H4_ROMCU